MHLQKGVQPTSSMRNGHVARAHLPQLQVTVHCLFRVLHPVTGTRQSFSSWYPKCSGFMMLGWNRWIIAYVLNKARIMCGSKPSDVGGKFWCDEPLDWWYIWERSCVKDENWLFSLNTSTRNFSASALVLGVIVISLPKFLSNSVGWALRADFLVPTLLVVSHPVKQCKAGRT